MQHIESSPVMKRNPRPRKYASDAERQAAFRARNVMVEFRAENKTADTLNKIADEIDVSRSDLVLSMVKFALTNHDWARFGLTHKTIPLYKGNPMATKKPSPAQLAARQKFADMVRARAAAAKGKKMPRKTVKKNPSEAPLHHLYGNKYFKIMKNNGLFEVVIVQKVNTGIGTEYDYYDGKTFKTLAGASRWINKHTPPKTNPRKKTVGQKISQLEHEGYPHKQSIAIALSEQRKGKVRSNPNQYREAGEFVHTVNGKSITRFFENTNDAWANSYGFEYRLLSNVTKYGSPVKFTKTRAIVAIDEGEDGKPITEIWPIRSLKFYQTNPSKKTVNQKRNPSGEIGAYEITKNFKVLGIFRTKADAIKAAQGISDATGKTIAVKPVQVLAGHFDR
jgi:hypothetical protein